MIYGTSNMAASFRTVRKNTIAVATDIPADKYSFRPVPDVKSVREMLAHIATSTHWQITLHTEGITAASFEMFSKGMAAAAAEEQALQTKDQIIAALETKGEEFASFLEGLNPDRLGETVTFPAPLQPPVKTRFEMLLSAKEHEMHHRGQLMLIERLLGIVPHGTRQRQAAAQARA